MTTKRDKKDEPKAKRPKLKKETLKDLDAVREGEGIRGGSPSTLALAPSGASKGTMMAGGRNP